MPVKKRKLNISIIGAGRVGSTLAVALKKRGHPIVSVVSRSLHSARRLGRRVACRNCSDDISLISPGSSLILITTPESVVGEVSRSLSDLKHLAFERIAVAHTSGALSSDVLSDLAARGARTFSFHPIQSFPPLGRSPEEKILEGIWYGFEGPQNSRAVARLLASVLGGRILEVPKEKKIVYHLACVFASNYPVVVLGALEILAGQVTGKQLAPFRKLFDSSIGRSFDHGAGKALTGPLTRGSLDVLHRHMIELGSSRPDLLPLYSALGLFGLELLGERKSLTEEQIRQMSAILSGNDDR